MKSRRDRHEIRDGPGLSQKRFPQLSQVYPHRQGPIRVGHPLLPGLPGVWSSLFRARFFGVSGRVFRLASGVGPKSFPRVGLCRVPSSPPQGAPDRDPGSYPEPEPESGLTVPSRASSRIFSRSLPGPARLPGVDPGGLNIHVDRGFRGAYTFGAARASAAQLFVFVPAGSRWTAWLEKSGGTTHEADLSAQASAPEAQPRVLCTDVHPGWAWRAGSSPSEGSQAPLGLALVPDRLKTLKKPREFDRVFRQGRSVAGQHLVLYCLKRPRAGRRVAFCVSKKLGSAVVRNRIRRRLREVYRLNQEKLAARWDLIILARPAALGAAFQALETTFLSLAARAGLVREVASPACSVGERSS